MRQTCCSELKDCFKKLLLPKRHFSSELQLSNLEEQSAETTGGPSENMRYFFMLDFFSIFVHVV